MINSLTKVTLGTDPRSEGTLLFIASNPQPPICIGDPWFVRIWPDGTLDYSDGYTPDEAARTFWEALALFSPRCTCGALVKEPS